MKFNNPTLINYVRVAKGDMVPLGALDESDFDKWLAMYNRALRAHWERRRAQLNKESQATDA
jgi:hypothetical protein